MYGSVELYAWLAVQTKQRRSGSTNEERVARQSRQPLVAPLRLPGDADCNAAPMALALGAPIAFVQPPPLPGIYRAEQSLHPLILGASPGTTGSMSIYFALVTLGVGTVHYSRQFNASDGTEASTYADDGGPVPLLRPLFNYDRPAGMPPPVNIAAIRSIDLRFLSATEALLDTPSMEIFFDALATFPNARVIISTRDAREWAASRRARHPSDRAPMFHLFGCEAQNSPWPSPDRFSAAAPLFC